MSKKILITGAAGFLGSHLSDEIYAMGEEIIAVDNFQTGRRENIQHILDTKDEQGFKLIECDIANTDEVWRKLSYYMPFQSVFNLACPASPPAYQQDPIKTTMTCVLGTKNMLDIAVKSKCSMLQASTSEIYGDPKVNPQPETYLGYVNPIGPRSCYDEGKRCAESLCFDYQRVHNINVRVARIFNTYGPRMDPFDGRVITNFIRQALANEDITLYGYGTQTRSFCFVDDLIDGILKLAKTKNEITSPINLGNDSTEFSIFDIARKVLDLIPKSKSKIVLKDLPIDDPKQRRPDLTLAKTLLGYNPTISLEKGLIETIEYMKQK